MLLISFISTFIEFVSPLEKQIDISRLLLNGKNTILLNHNCIVGDSEQQVVNDFKYNTYLYDRNCHYTIYP